MASSAVRRRRLIHEDKMLHTFRPQADNSSWEALREDVTRRLPTMRDGLYVMVFANDDDLEVRDNNKGREKTVIHAHGASLKPGKFEAGLVTRLTNYSGHLHRLQRNGSMDMVFASCLRRLLVLDLSGVDLGVSAARVFERYWVHGAGSFLRDKRLVGDLPQIERSEWRYLDAGRWNSRLDDELATRMLETAERIGRMIEVARKPT